MTRRSRNYLGLLIAMVTTLSGCSGNTPKTVAVQGKVMFGKVEPLPNATIQFVPVSETDSFSANGTTDENGTFQLQTYISSKRATLDGVVPGKYKVVVIPYPHGKRIAQNYGSPVSTPLTVEIPEAGITKLTLEVSSGPERK